MTRGLSILIVVAACGGTAKESTAPKETDPEAERELAEMRGRADRACACKNRVCARRFDAALEREIRAEMATADPADASTLDAQELEPIFEQVVRMYRCIGAQGVIAYSFGVFALWKLGEIKDRACACADAACMRQAAQDWDGVLADFEHVPGSPQTLAEIAQINGVAQACFVRFFELESDAAVREIEALRKVACQCADATCAGAVTRAFDEYVEKYKHTRGTQSLADTIAKVADELDACLDAAQKARR